MSTGARIASASRPRRPFGLLDLMIAVVACGPALLLLKLRLQILVEANPPSAGRAVTMGYAVGQAALIAATLALVPMALRRPRPRLRAWMRRPGVAAVLAALAALIVSAARTATKVRSMWEAASWDELSWRFMVWRFLNDDQRIGYAVVGAWLALALAGVARPDRSWIDRTGRMLGWGWIVLALLPIALPWLMPWIPAL